MAKFAKRKKIAVTAETFKSHIEQTPHINRQ